MLPIQDLSLGFNDAENYKRRENKDLFNKIFLKNEYLERLCKEEISFLIGEKGTGKTAYAVFFENSKYQNINGHLKYIRETEYQKFIHLKNENHLDLSDFTSIWKVIIYLLISKTILENNKRNPIFKTFSKFNNLNKAIDDFYDTAFSPEIIEALQFVENSSVAAKLLHEHVEAGMEVSRQKSGDESRFQTNLLYIQRRFESALQSLKLDEGHVLFIDGIDIRPESIPYESYLDCVKGLANAVWSVNNDFFANIKDSKGRLRCVLLIRPDIFNSLGLQNSNNKIRDNSVLLDWRTTYENYRHSEIFRLSDRLLRVQQEKDLEAGASWDYYFPFDSVNVDTKLKFPTSFISFLRFSLYRPRDIVTMIGILQEIFIEKQRGELETFNTDDFDNADFRRKYSFYLLGEIKDHLAFYYSDDDYELFLKFFEFLNGKYKFIYKDYLNAFSKYTYYIDQNNLSKPQFCDSHGMFLQFLYDLNILSYVDYTDDRPFIRWCFRQREPSNISPKVKMNTDYEIHYALGKALNLGSRINVKSDLESGTVNWFDKKKGYGFITLSDGSGDVFIHLTTVQAANLGTLEKGQRVLIDLVPGREGKLSVSRVELPQ